MCVGVLGGVQPPRTSEMRQQDTLLSELVRTAGSTLISGATPDMVEEVWDSCLCGCTAACGGHGVSNGVSHGVSHGCIHVCLCVCVRVCTCSDECVCVLCTRVLRASVCVYECTVCACVRACACVCVCAVLACMLANLNVVTGEVHCTRCVCVWCIHACGEVCRTRLCVQCVSVMRACISIE